MKKKVLAVALSVLLLFGAMHMIAHADFGDFSGEWDYGDSYSRDGGESGDDKQYVIDYDAGTVRDQKDAQQQERGFFRSGTSSASASPAGGFGMLILIAFVAVIGGVLFIAWLRRR